MIYVLEKFKLYLLYSIHYTNNKINRVNMYLRLAKKKYKIFNMM